MKPSNHDIEPLLEVLERGGTLIPGPLGGDAVLRCDMDRVQDDHVPGALVWQLCSSGLITRLPTRGTHGVRYGLSARGFQHLRQARAA